MSEHRTLSRILVVTGALLGVLAILAVWVGRQALETDQWTQTSAKILDDPAVQTAVAGYLVDQLYANTDVAGELRTALPPQAKPLAAPAAGALRNAAEGIAVRALDRPRVQQAWENANRKAHTVLVNIIEDKGNVVSTNNGVVALDLKALLDEVAQRTGIGARAAAKLPDSAASIEIMRSDQLGAVQTIGKWLKPLAVLLVLLMLGCFAGAIALARDHRRETLRGCGFALIFAGIVALIARRLLGDEVVGQLAATDATKPAVQAVWDIGTSLLVGVAGATILYGVLTVIGAWVAGPSRPATATRRTLAPYLRDPRLTYGVVAGVVLLVLLWGPTEGTRRLLPALVLTALLVIGVEALRRVTARQFPEAERGQAQAPGAFRAWSARRRAAELERLSDLHRTGELDDAEYAAAKKDVLSHV